MTLLAKQPAGSNIEPIETGNFQAVCYSVIDLGTQRSELFDNEAHKVAITWEIPSLRIELEGKDLPRAITKTYTISLHEKANLYKDLVSWRGKVFTQEELEGFDLTKIVMANCLLQIIHNKKGDKVYANVAAVTKLVKGMELVEPENPTITYDMTRDGYDIPEGIPNWIKDIIKKSVEWQAVHKAQENPDLAAAQQSQDWDESPGGPEPPSGDQIPF